MTKTSYEELWPILEKYDVVIGIEVHCQLASKRKIFSSSQNRYGDSPNSNIDPVCLGLPGALPHLNEECVDLAIRMGLALNCDIQRVSTFARKNYFYPDLPKGYQISQFDKPICLNGFLECDSGKKVILERIQLEEDSGKNIHVGSVSLIDYNRSGVGLIEIITTPCLSGPEEASEYLRKLHSLTVHLGVSHGDLERGNFRADANVSLKPKGEAKLGERCEIKNVNSFKYIEKAIAYEILRQYRILNNGEIVERETRGYNSDLNETFPMRTKGAAQDYRFFPEPDLRPLVLSEERIERIKQVMPELPWEREKRFVQDYSLPEYDAKILASSKVYSAYFEAMVSRLSSSVSSKQISNYFMTDVLKAVKIIAEQRGLSELEELPIPLSSSCELLEMIAKGEISGRTAKEVFDEMLETGKGPREIATAKGLQQVSDEGEIKKFCEEVLLSYPIQLEEYLSGKDKLFGFFIGQSMKIAQGRLNPALVNDAMKEALEAKRRAYKKE